MQDFILVNIPFCGVEEFSSYAESEEESFINESLTPGAAAKIEEGPEYLDVWTDETRNDIARLWSEDYFRELETLTGIKVNARTSEAVWGCDGSWGREWIDVYVNPVDLQKVFDENRDKIAAAIAFELSPSEGFAPFPEAIEEAERFDVTNMRPALIEAGLSGVLDAYSSSKTVGLIKFGAYPRRIDSGLSDVFYSALYRSAKSKLGAYAMWHDIEAAEESGEIRVECVPQSWVPYLVNADPSGLTEEDVKRCDAWAEYVVSAGYSPWSIEPLELEPFSVPDGVKVMLPRLNG